MIDRKENIIYSVSTCRLSDSHYEHNNKYFTYHKIYQFTGSMQYIYIIISDNTIKKKINTTITI